MVRKLPSVFLLAFVVTGIWSADYFRLPVWVFFGCLVVTGVAGLFALSRQKTAWAIIAFAVCLACFAGLSFGLTQYQPGPDHISRVVKTGETYHLFGRVSDWPELKTNRTVIRVDLDSIIGDHSRQVVGAILLKVSDTTTALQRGDRIEFMGRIYSTASMRASTGFDYNRYLSLKGVFGVVYLSSLLDVRVDKQSRFALIRMVDNLRDAIRKSLWRNLEPRQAALASGFLIGETRDIPTDIYRMFRDSGTLHLLAVSGSNVALVLVFVLFMLRPFRISLRMRSIVLLAAILIFAELSYEEPSVIRASIMAALVIGARLLERRYDLNNIIAVTALLILLYDPTQFFDVGFRLSFATAWGLIFCVPKLAELFKSHHSQWWYRFLVFPALISLVAQIVSSPIIIYHFQRLPVLSVIANLLVVPLVSAAVIGTLIMLMADLIWPLLGQFAGSLLNVLLSAVVKVLELLGGENMTVLYAGDWIEGSLSLLWIIGTYTTICLGVAAIKRRRLLKLSIVTGLVMANLALAASVVSLLDEERTHLKLIEVPGGIAALVARGGADQDLVITGLRDRDYPIDERILAPWLESCGIDRIKSMFVLSADFKAVRDLLALAARFDCQSVYFPISLRSMTLDLANLDHGPGRFGPSLHFFSPADGITGESGYHLQESGLQIILPQGSILMISRLTHNPARVSPVKTPATLILGSQWQPVPEDWLALNRSGFDLIVASQIRPRPVSDFNSDHISPDPPLPDYVVDLNRVGPMRLYPQSGRFAPD